MPQPFAPRCFQPLGNGARSVGVLAHQKVPHAWIAEIGVMHQIEQGTRDFAGGLGEIGEPVDRLGELRRAPRAVAHLAFDEARIDGAAAHDASERRRKRPRARALGIGHIEHDQLRHVAERGGSRGKAADEGRVLRAFEQIARRIVGAVQQKIGGSHASREAARLFAAFAIRAPIDMRGGSEIGSPDLVRVHVAAEQILGTCPVSAGRIAEDAGEV